MFMKKTLVIVGLLTMACCDSTNPRLYCAKHQVSLSFDGGPLAYEFFGPLTSKLNNSHQTEVQLSDICYLNFETPELGTEPSMLLNQTACSVRDPGQDTMTRSFSGLNTANLRQENISLDLKKEILDLSLAGSFAGTVKGNLTFGSFKHIVSAARISCSDFSRAGGSDCLYPEAPVQCQDGKTYDGSSKLSF